MRVFFRSVPRGALTAAALFLALPYAASPRGAQPAASGVTVTCSFSNPGYSGWCRQTETVPAGRTPARVCGAILTCLNDSRCAKTYCNSTSIRGNWRLEKVVTRSGGPRTNTTLLP